MAEQRLRIGFVGAGRIVRRRHMPGLAKVPGVEYAAVANRRPESTAAFAEEFGIRQTFDDWRALVEWDGIDVVWCGTYPNLHRPVTEAALAAGKHVFCQARMALSYEDAKAMYLAAQRSDRTTVLCQTSNYAPGDATVRRLLAEGFIGQPYSLVMQGYNNRFAPADVRSVVEEYLFACRRRGILEVRLVHGRGKGVQRASVRQLLATLDGVEHFHDAPAQSGGWGATLVRLRAPQENSSS